jgi:hypothetical protein
MKTKCMGSAGSKEALTALINKQFYSTNWIITDDNKLYNSKLNKFMEDVIIKVTGGRWQLRRIENE